MKKGRRPASRTVYCPKLCDLLFPMEQRPKVQSYLSQVRARLDLEPRHVERLLEDHVKAVFRLTQRGMGLEEALRVLDPSRLGDFYRDERRDWYPLDTAAKLYPMSMSPRRMAIFRLSAYLRAPVEPELMQMALTYVMRRFPYFATSVKAGVFWHYVDGVKRHFAVSAEHGLPCSVMPFGRGTSPALRVSYFENRVSVEFFHALTDGTGGCVFLMTLVRTYLRLMGHEVPDGPEGLPLDEPPAPCETADGFTLAADAPGARGFADRPALQMRGIPGYEQPCRVLHFNLPTQALSAQAREKGVTVTTLMLGYLFSAARAACPQRPSRRQIQIQLPVNMRRFYPVGTLRNFSLYASVRLAPADITGLDGILPAVARQVEEGVRKEALDATLRLSRRLVRSLRLVPLFIKRPIAYFIFGMLGDGVFTTTLSNLGLLRASKEMESLVEKIDFVLGPPSRSRACCAMASFGGTTVLTVTKSTQHSAFEDALYNLLCDGGLRPRVEGTRGGGGT